VNDMPVLDPALLDLLVEWEESKISGVSLSVEEVCARCPDQIDALRRYVERIAHIESLLELVDAHAPPMLPGFEQLEEIGRGGMGIVYKARDVQLDEVVAIKVPFGSRNGVSSRRRFEREAKTLAKLRHKSIVPVRTAGFAGDTPYLVMDYVPGGSLSERMKEVAGTPMKATGLMSQVARAVDHAHRAGIVHRDLKPANILLSKQGEPLVSDFGIAAVLSGDSLNNHVSENAGINKQSVPSVRLTTSLAAVGTPAYLPPEAFSGGRGNATTAADVWSLGVILCECLTGQAPYPDPETGDRHYKTPLPRPASLHRGVPRRLDRIVQRCLTIEPTGRYSTAAAIADDLERWMWRVELQRRMVRFASYGLVAIAALLVLGMLVRPKSSEEHHIAESQKLTVELTRDRRIDLIGETGAPRTHFVRVNQSLASTGTTKDKIFFVECTRPCLVELLPDVPSGRFRFTAELRQMTGVGDCEVGLYFGHAEVTSQPKPSHRFLCLSFADLGLLPTSYTSPNGQRGSALFLQAFRYRPPDIPIGLRDQKTIDWKWYRPSAEMPGPWRQVTLEVSSDWLTCGCDGAALEPCPTSVVDRSFASPRFPGGGIGIYTNNCTVECRNCNITLLLPSSTL
jgi:serine/threonine protein kinase